MAVLRTIIEGAVRHLAERLEDSAHVDKDRGQLEGDGPGPEFPCVLVDVDQINYTRGVKGTERAEATIRVTVAGKEPRESPSPGNGTRPRPGTRPGRGNDNSGGYDPYGLLDLADRTHEALALYNPGGHSPLCRTGLRKTFSEQGEERYVLTYELQFSLPAPGGEPDTVPVSTININM